MMDKIYKQISLLIIIFLIFTLSYVFADQEAEAAKKFQGSWISPSADFKSYEIIFIDEVDVDSIRERDGISKEDLSDLSNQMRDRFSKILNNVMPVVLDRAGISGKKAMCINLKLINITSTNTGANALMQVVGFISRIPLPTPSSEGTASFEAIVTDLANGEKLIVVSDDSKADKNASIAGTEGLSKWKHAYNTMDYWADCLAALIAEKRGEEYKSQLKTKLI
ncbi:MAG: DUF3313 family protein [Candidatus Omnitrophota bacterium]